jgi:hypothetical protein
LLCEKNPWNLHARGEFNIAIGSLPTLQISLGIVALSEKIYDGKPILTVFQKSGMMYIFNTVVSNKCMM